ncbi:hypothetical protein [Streptomyces sp. NPDC088812]|uniref:hypothetical protein n=1 Tax=Streptomyces sp. NPDC088812 TaxID=3365905 RepID=UPI0037F28802
MTLVLFAALQVVVPYAIRPHYASPVTADVPVTAETVRNLSVIGHYGKVGGLTVPGGPWVVSTSTRRSSRCRPIRARPTRPRAASRKAP